MLRERGNPFRGDDPSKQQKNFLRLKRQFLVAQLPEKRKMTTGSREEKKKGAVKKGRWHGNPTRPREGSHIRAF